MSEVTGRNRLPQFLSVAEVAAALRIDRKTVHKLLASGALPHVRLPRRAAPRARRGGAAPRRDLSPQPLARPSLGSDLRAEVERQARGAADDRTGRRRWVVSGAAPEFFACVSARPAGSGVFTLPRLQAHRALRIDWRRPAK